MSAKTILIVEAQRHIMRLIQVNLQRAGYEVMMASSGQEALEQIGRRRPDVLVIDYDLPDMTSNELGQKIYDWQNTQRPPALLLIPKNLEPGSLDAWYAYPNCNCHLTKPFRPEEVIHLVSRILEAAEEAAGRHNPKQRE